MAHSTKEKSLPHLPCLYEWVNKTNLIPVPFSLSGSLSSGEEEGAPVQVVQSAEAVSLSSGLVSSLRRRVRSDDDEMHASPPHSVRRLDGGVRGVSLILHPFENIWNSVPPISSLIPFIPVFLT